MAFCPPFPSTSVSAPPISSLCWCTGCPPAPDWADRCQPLHADMDSTVGGPCGHPGPQGGRMGLMHLPCYRQGRRPPSHLKQGGSCGMGHLRVPGRRRHDDQCGPQRQPRAVGRCRPYDPLAAPQHPHAERPASMSAEPTTQVNSKLVFQFLAVLMPRVTAACLAPFVAGKTA